MPRTLCTCGSGLLPRFLRDSAGVVIGYVCDACEAHKRFLYLGSVFAGSRKNPQPENRE